MTNIILDYKIKTMNESKDMQDLAPAHVACSKCGAVIIQASRIHAYRERDVRRMIEEHKCQDQMQQKRDFQNEVI